MLVYFRLKGDPPLGRSRACNVETQTMSNLITGTHLQADDLDGKNIQKALEDFGEWLKSAKFEPLTDEIYRCYDKDRKRKVDPILTALKYNVRNLHL